MVRSFGLGIPGTCNVYIGMNVLLVVTTYKWEQVVTLRDTLNVNNALKGSN